MMDDRDSMAKYPKFRVSLSSFQLCRSTKPSSLPITPLPRTLSPVNSKAFDIAYPIIIPNPPPSTPNHDLNVVGSKIMPLDLVCQSRSCTVCVAPDHFYKKDGHRRNSDGINALPIAPPPAGKKKKTRRKKSKPSFREGIDSSCNSNAPLEKTSEDSLNGNMKREPKNVKVRGSKNGWKTTTVRTNSERMMPCTINGKMSKSFAVLKKSLNPYEDFKKSMLEMIMENEMFEAVELEQLLQCFLSLNSQHHHTVIVKAFTEILEDFFTASSN
ncbi:transcription repressor OFP7-like [Olea europaea var. sylvestris]|uniref:transcription repressor OFP7-like n=1 Tax=Olea europaea var. sylvestris TaxID=158386 RepID=UPI000C1CDE79|nr:transcription repressor OFP7-like [Olea europaea var. sylvestris]